VKFNSSNPSIILWTCRYRIKIWRSLQSKTTVAKKLSLNVNWN